MMNYLEMGKIYYIFTIVIIKHLIIMENKKIYNFYVLFDESCPEKIRYVGTTTKKIEERFSQHKYCAIHPEKRGLPVHKWMYSIYKNGGKIGIKKIDECNEDLWEDREKYWINYYKTIGFNLMNLDSGGKGVITKEKRSLNSIERSIKGHEKAIIALNKDGSFFKEFESGVKASEELHISKTSIQNNLSKRSKSAGGYIWVYKKDYNKNETYSYSPRKYENSKCVYCFDLKGNLIQKYESIGSIEKLSGYSRNGLLFAINNKKIYHNYYWNFDNIINIDEYEKYDRYEVIYQNTSKKFRTLTDLSKDINISLSTLSTKLKGNTEINIKDYTIKIIN